MNTFQSIVQHVAGSPPGAWFLRTTRIDAQDRLLHRITGGRATVTGIFAGFPTVLVTTSGRRTGRAHTVPLVMVSDPARPGAVGLIASNFGQGHDPDWCLNLRAHPRAIVTGDGAGGRYAATEVTGDDYERWFALGTAIYSGYPAYRGRAGRRIPIFELTPYP